MGQHGAAQYQWGRSYGCYVNAYAIVHNGTRHWRRLGLSFYGDGKGGRQWLEYSCLAADSILETSRDSNLKASFVLGSRCC